MALKIVVLNGHSLFVEGVLSRLRQHEDQFDLQVIDTQQGDTLLQLATLHPAAIILDESDPEISERRLLEELLVTLPSLKIICLDSNSTQVKVIHLEKQRVTDVTDLIGVIEPAEGGPAIHPRPTAFLRRRPAKHALEAA